MSRESQELKRSLTEHTLRASDAPATQQRQQSAFPTLFGQRGRTTAQRRGSEDFATKLLRGNVRKISYVDDANP